MRIVRTMVLIACIALLLGGCARSKVICGVEYAPYGLLDADDKKNPDIEYDVVWGNIFWGVVLAETIVAPVYFGGFSLFEPIGVKSKTKGAIGSPRDCGAIRG